MKTKSSVLFSLILIVLFLFSASVVEGETIYMQGFESGNYTDSPLINEIDVSESIFEILAINDMLFPPLSLQFSYFGTDTVILMGVNEGMFSGLYPEPSEWVARKSDADAPMAATARSFPIPEPATLLFCGIGLIGMATVIKKNKIRHKGHSKSPLSPKKGAQKLIAAADSRLVF